MTDKNRDFLPPEMIETMRQSSYDVVKLLFTGLLTKTGNLTIPSKPKLGWREALVAEKENRRNRVRHRINHFSFFQLYYFCVFFCRSTTPNPEDNILNHDK